MNSQLNCLLLDYFQEIESIRNEMQQLRNQVLKSSMQNQSAAAAAAAAQNFARVASGRNGAGVNMVSATDWTSFRNALPSLTNPCRVRKLTKFFGDEPPLVRIFLKKLGYEVGDDDDINMTGLN